MATYIRLTDYKSSDAKEEGFFKPVNRYEAKQEDFAKIPGSPIAYWVNKKIYKLFTNNPKLGELASPRKGNSTSNNDRFLRQWFEISEHKMAINYTSVDLANDDNKKWIPYNKGGGYRKWYGFNESLINWENNGYEISQIKSAVITNTQYYMIPGITWSTITTSKFGVRDFSHGFIFDNGGCCIFVDDLNKKYFTSLLNSNTFTEIFSKINPTINFQSGEIAKFPVIFPFNKSIREQINQLTQQNINISKEEWDSRETSWDFKENGLLRFAREIAASSATPRNDGMEGKIEDAYNAYCNYWREKFTTLHANEEELNRLFIDIYELQDELSWHVELKDITILKQESDIVDGKLVFDTDEIMKQFVSYGVGVMFGRYSLDKEGLWIANMGQDVEILNQVQNDGGSGHNDAIVSFEIDDDNIIPVLEDDYFKDDMASRFVQFVKVTFGEQNLRENIRFIESSLGTPLRKYFVKGFYEDHLKRYKKRPIYWMVSSPKKGFMSLIYMHRYQSDTFARVRNSYLTEYIAKLEAHKDTLHLTTTSDTASDKDKKDADKRIKDIDTKLKELIAFDRDTMMHFAQNNTEIDLDDGVKVNYSKFREILYEIKGLNKDE